MELRAVLLILAGLAAFHTQAAGQVLRYPLDDRMVYAVRIGTDAPTTVMFPGPLTAIDAAGISGKVDDQPPVMLSHQDGSRYFSVRALRSGAVAAANVVFHDRVYAFAFRADGEPDRTVTLHERPGEATAAASVSRRRPERMLTLLDQARNYEALSAQYPALVQGVERAAPLSRAVLGSLVAVTEEVLRFPSEDAVVLRFRVENGGDRDCRFIPAHLAVRAGEVTFPAALTDAVGLVPARSSVVIHVVLVGNPDGSPANLSVRNTFTLAWPASDSVQ